MRVGTWNLAGRWSPGHRDLLLGADCDVWLLTEVSERTELPEYAVHCTAARMAERRPWAGVASRWAMRPLADPHAASAAAEVAGVTFVSSVLPWRGVGPGGPWVGARHADKTAAAVEDLLVHLRTAHPLVWGGDWNHALTGAEHAGSAAGRDAIAAALRELGLSAPTTHLRHPIDGLLTIDHVAVPDTATATATRVVASAGGTRLSDHDAYVVDVVGIVP